MEDHRRKGRPKKRLAETVQYVMSDLGLSSHLAFDRTRKGNIH